MDNVDNLELVKETLERRGVSQTKLAELLGVNLTTVNNWFRRDSIPPKYMDNIAMLFNIKIKLSKEHTANIDTYEELNIQTINNIISVKHIDDNKNVIFSIDKSLIGLKEINNIRFNTIQSTTKRVDIIDKLVDNYCGDGVYYIKYPHGVIPKQISYNFSKNNYSVCDISNSTSIFEVDHFNNNISGKVIVRIEVV